MKKFSPTALASALLALAGLSMSMQALAQVQPSFGQCDERVFVTQTDIVQLNPYAYHAQLYLTDTTTNPFGFLPVGGPTPNLIAYNAMGYNLNDNYLYAIKYAQIEGQPVGVFGGNHLIRIGADGSAQDLGLIAGLPADGYGAGEFAPDGSFYVSASTGAAEGYFYRINVGTLTATRIPFSEKMAFADFTFTNGRMYGIDNESKDLISVDTTGQVTHIGPTGLTDRVVIAIGAPNGLFIGDSDFIYQVDIKDGSTTKVAVLPVDNDYVGSGDGAKCVTSDFLLPADLVVTKTNTPASGPNDLAGDMFLPGTEVTYSITVANRGPFGIQNAAFYDLGPARTTPLRWTCKAVQPAGDEGTARCPAASGTGQMTPLLIDFEFNSAVEIEFTIAVPLEFNENLRNQAEVMAPSGYPEEIDPDRSNNRAIDEDTPSIADLQVVKTATPDPVRPGELINYTLTLTNNGPLDVTNGLLTDTPGAALDCTQPVTTATCQATGSARCPGGTVAISDLLGAGVTIPSLPVGDEIKISMQCKVSASGKD